MHRYIYICTSSTSATCHLNDVYIAPDISPSCISIINLYKVLYLWITVKVNQWFNNATGSCVHLKIDRVPNSINRLCLQSLFKIGAINNETAINHKWASARDFGIYITSEHRRHRRVCAYAQTRQSLRCSHTQSMDIDEGSVQNLDL